MRIFSNRTLCRLMAVFLTILLLSPGIVLLWDGLAVLDTKPLGELMAGIWPTIADTLILGVGSALLAVFLGGIASFFLVKVRLWRFLWIVVLLALPLPLHIHTSTWLILSGRSGLLTPFIQTIFPDFSMYTIWGAIWITGISYTPLATLLCGISFASIPSILEEQASFYLTPWQRVWLVILPQCRWGLCSAWLVVFILGLGEITVTDVLGIDTLTRKVYLFLSLYYRPDLAILLSLSLIAVTFAGCIFLYFAGKRSGCVLVQNWRQTNALAFSWRWKLCGIILLPFTMIYLLSIPVLLFRAESLQNLWNTYQAVSPELWNSLWICCISALLIAASGLLLGWYIARSFPLALLLFCLSLWLAMMPAPLTGIGILRLTEKGLDIPLVGQCMSYLRDTNAIVCFGLWIRYLPYAIWICMLAVSFIPKQLEETASLQGYPPFSRFLYLVLPLSRKGLGMAFLTAFVFCLGELGTTLLIIPPGTTTISIRIFTLLHYGVRADVACCSIYIVFAIAALLFVGYLAAKSATKNGNFLHNTDRAEYR